ncbi:MAG: hypothetical protein M3N53_05695 [Actinomycetota bacterium]|nr:hypothetical protein [Actinomycetota bacterium]
MTKPAVQLLDTTIRDGSYVVDFQFTARDTAVIAAALDDAGVELIEVGHGLGLNASEATEHRAADSDAAYIEAALAVVKAASCGVFFIPGIGRQSDIEMAARAGIGFLRVGTNVTEAEDALPYIEFAKSLGLVVSANFMKSYAVSATELGERAAQAQKAGADIVSVVDSSGGMLPADVRDYSAAVLDRCAEIRLGFHGHDNLGLAIANTLAAVQSGATVVDASLAGMGRSAGNAITEILVLVLRRAGIDLGLNANALMDAAASVVRPMVDHHKHDPLSITSGFAHFHSSFLGKVLRYADEYQVDPRELIVDLCAHDRVHAPDDLIQDLAKQLTEARMSQRINQTVVVPRDWSGISAKPATAAIGEVVGRLVALSKKSGKPSVFNIVAPISPSAKTSISRVIQSNFAYVIASAEVCDEAALREILRAIDGRVDIVLVDTERNDAQDPDFRSVSTSLITESELLFYKDTDVWARAACIQVEELVGDPRYARIALFGWNSIAMKICTRLAELGADLVLTGASHETLTGARSALLGLPLVEREITRITTEPEPARAAAGVTGLIGCAFENGRITEQMVEQVDRGGFVLDSALGSVSGRAIIAGDERGLLMLRVDMRGALAAEVASLIAGRTLVREMMGRTALGGHPVVSSGQLGQAGDVVVDSIGDPKRVLGVADGSGGMLHELDDATRDRVRAVELEILKTQKSVV